MSFPLSPSAFSWNIWWTASRRWRTTRNSSTSRESGTVKSTTRSRSSWSRTCRCDLFLCQGVWVARQMEQAPVTVSSLATAHNVLELVHPTNTYLLSPLSDRIWRSSCTRNTWTKSFCNKPVENCQDAKGVWKPWHVRDHWENCAFLPGGGKVSLRPGNGRVATMRWVPTILQALNTQFP